MSQWYPCENPGKHPDPEVQWHLGVPCEGCAKAARLSLAEINAVPAAVANVPPFKDTLPKARLLFEMIISDWEKHRLMQETMRVSKERGIILPGQ